MVEELSSSNQNGMRNLTRMIQWHMHKSQNSSVLTPGSLDPALCRCPMDGEDFILKDEIGALYIGSRKLWESVFGQLQVRTVVCDGRFKQIPRDLHPTRTSQLYTIIAEVDGGHTFPLLFAFLPDGKEATYRSLFRWFKENIEPYGGDAAIADERCNFLTASNYGGAAGDDD